MKQCICPLIVAILNLSIVGTMLCAGLAHAQNPVPQVVGPPNPQAVSPGGEDFTLKVYGANFVPGSVVNWNRQPRATTYISGHEVDATILASDIVSNMAGYVTVTNPPPGGGVSSANWTLVEVHDPTATIAPGSPNLYVYANGGEAAQLLIADFNNDGIMDLADADAAGQIPIFLGNGAGAFNFADVASSLYWANFGYNNSAYGDFNGDGNLDLAYQAFFGVNNPPGLDVSLGNGDGSFRAGWRKDDDTVVNVLAGDFNSDGKLDLIAGNGHYTNVFLGNGDGTFQLSKTYSFGADGIRLAGDFNGDGKLDLILVYPTIGTQNYTGIAIALGNGDGTFQEATLITTYTGGCAAFSPAMLVNDFNNDGNLDIAFCTPTSIGVMLGNGDGTFQEPIFYYVDSQLQFSFAAGDFNSDGKTDLIVSEFATNWEFAILLGNGDGTFQPKAPVTLRPKMTNGEGGIAVGDFNSDGLLDFILQEGGYGFVEYLQVEQ